MQYNSVAPLVTAEVEISINKVQADMKFYPKL